MGNRLLGITYGPLNLPDFTAPCSSTAIFIAVISGSYSWAGLPSWWYVWVQPSSIGSKARLVIRHGPGWLPSFNRKPPGSEEDSYPLPVHLYTPRKSLGYSLVQPRPAATLYRLDQKKGHFALESTIFIRFKIALNFWLACYTMKNRAKNCSSKLISNEFLAISASYVGKGSCCLLYTSPSPRD